jgi:hypothetical protein
MMTKASFLSVAQRLFVSVVSALAIVPSATAQSAVSSCEEALRAALYRPHSLEACDLFKLAGGGILVLRIDKTICFIAEDKGRAARFAVDLQSRKIDVAVAPPKETPRSAVVDPQAFADAKFFYYPFDKTNRLRDRLVPGRSGYLCLPSQALKLEVALLSAHACPRAS